MKSVLAVSLALTSLFFIRPQPTEAQPEQYEFFYNRKVLRQGDIVQVSTRLPFGSKDGRATFRGEEYHGYLTGGLFNILLGIDLDTKPGDHVLSYKFDNGDEREFTLPIVAREFGRESLKVASMYTDLDAPTQARVAREKKMLEGQWARSSPDRLWKGAFLKPSLGELGSPFGLRRFFNEQPRSPHAGLDLKAPAGSGVYASNYGKVVVAEDLFFTGNTIIIDHGQSVYTIYAHLSEMKVKNGDDIERAEPIGLVGDTGRVTGAHLHFGVKVNGQRVDPATLPGALF